MARLSIIVCDLCNVPSHTIRKGTSKEELPYNLSLQQGKGKDKEVHKAEICKKCFDGIITKLSDDFNVNTLPQINMKQVVNIPPKVIAEGETIVPSSAENITDLPSKNENTCSHEKASFEPPGKMKCRDCEFEWRV